MSLIGDINQTCKEVYIYNTADMWNWLLTLFRYIRPLNKPFLGKSFVNVRLLAEECVCVSVSGRVLLLKQSGTIIILNYAVRESYLSLPRACISPINHNIFISVIFHGEWSCVVNNPTYPLIFWFVRIHFNSILPHNHKTVLIFLVPFLERIWVYALKYKQ